MRFTIVPLIVIACILAASAADETALAKSKGCLACHQFSAKVVGPAYKDVAKRYTSGDADKLVKEPPAGRLSMLFDQLSIIFI